MFRWVWSIFGRLFAIVGFISAVVYAGFILAPTTILFSVAVALEFLKVAPILSQYPNFIMDGTSSIVLTAFAPALWTLIISVAIVVTLALPVLLLLPPKRSKSH